MVRKQFFCFVLTVHWIHALSSWNYKVPFTDCRIAQTGSYHFLAGGKVILEQNEVVFVKIIKMKHKKKARILNDLYIMSA